MTFKPILFLNVNITVVATMVLCLQVDIWQLNNSMVASMARGQVSRTDRRAFGIATIVAYP